MSAVKRGDMSVFCRSFLQKVYAFAKIIYVYQTFCALNLGQSRTVNYQFAKIVILTHAAFTVDGLGDYIHFEGEMPQICLNTLLK